MRNFYPVYPLTRGNAEPSLVFRVTPALARRLHPEKTGYCLRTVAAHARNADLVSAITSAATARERVVPNRPEPHPAICYSRYGSIHFRPATVAPAGTYSQPTQPR